MRNELFSLASFRSIVQAMFNLAYIQALFTLVVQMTRAEQEAWSKERHDSAGHRRYAQIVASRLLRTPLHSEQDNVTLRWMDELDT